MKSPITPGKAGDALPTVICADGIVREVHEYHCDCEWCWLGATERKPEPPSLLQRICRAILARGGSK
jgi:hypothetical protein